MSQPASRPVHRNPFARSAWSPYVAGAAIGILSWLVFAIADSPLGITTALSQASGTVAAGVVGMDEVTANPYWARTTPKWDYGTLFLFGVFLGSLASALLGRTFRIETVPAVWRERFGPSPWSRMIVAFIGGIIAMYGARMAGGCTSGNGLSGSLQLALSGWTFFITMFVAGVIVAWLMFGLAPRVPDTATHPTA